MGDNNTINENSDRNIHNLVDNQSIDIVENNQSDIAENTVNKRYNDPITGKFIKDNPGKPKGARSSLKVFQREEFENMTPEEKRDWLSDVDKITKWKMAEGNPHQDNNDNLQGEIILKISKEISDKYEINTNTGNSSPESETI